MKSKLLKVASLPYSAEYIWPILSDTSNLNKRMKLAPMHFMVKDGQRFGSQKMFGQLITWSERPWEWEKNRWLKNRRVYANGFLKSLEGYFELLPLTSSSTKLTITFTLEHRYKFLSPLLNWATLKIMNNLITEVGLILDEEKKIPEKNEIKDFKTWIELSDPQSRLRIAPKSVAKYIGVSWKEIFHDALLLDKRFGVSFDLICPHCRGSRRTVKSLTELPTTEVCDSCNIEFPVNTNDSVEVTLKDLTLPANFQAIDYCSADVKHKPDVFYQRLGGTWRTQLTASEGLYRLKIKSEATAFDFRVSQDAKSDVLEIGKKFNFQQERIFNNHLILDCQLTDDSYFMLEKLSADTGPLHFVEVISEPQFVDLIPSKQLATSFPIEMGNRAILFTDVVASTEMYFRLGDLKAFELVRESFLNIGKQVRNHNGQLVKTIGDATMYAFIDPADCYEAALSIQKNNLNNPVKLRASLHYGPCLCIGTGQSLDYFGDTINICAKFLSKADADEIVFEESYPLGHNISLNDFEKIPFIFKSLTTERSFNLFRIK